MQAVEAVTDGARQLLEAEARVPFRGRRGHLLLVALAGRHVHEDVMAIGESLAAEDVVVTETAADRAALWATRHAVAEAVRRQGHPHKLDLAIPLRRMATFLPAVEDLVKGMRAGALPVLVGHLADGNVRVNLVGVADDDDAIDDAVVELAMAYGGHASAEHGIGVAKGRWLAMSRSPAELLVLEQLRAVFDPDGILNRRVLR